MSAAGAAGMGAARAGVAGAEEQRPMTRTPKGIAELEDLDAIFVALASRPRRTILMVLHARGGSMTSRDIAARFDCAWPTTTRHLRVLSEARLVRVEPRGRERVYT
ncbi:MAG: ArsR/SmtB family transcription factor, partial [Acidimicrobiales bacterium]